MKHNAYEAAESLAHAAHKHIDMESAIASGNPDEGTFRLIVKGFAYNVIVRPLRYHEGPEADLAALREAAWAVVCAWWNGPETDAEIEPLRALLASTDSASQEETP